MECAHRRPARLEIRGGHEVEDFSGTEKDIHPAGDLIGKAFADMVLDFRRRLTGLSDPALQERRLHREPLVLDVVAWPGA